MKGFSRAISLMAISAGLLLASCNNNTIIRIQTDVPEIALLADKYQANSSVPSVVIEYRKQLDASFDNQNPPDLLIGRGLYNQPVIDKLESLNSLLESKSIDTNDFYGFSFIKQRGDLELVVLSWDLPAIITRVAETSLDFQEGIALPLDSLREKGAQYNVLKKGNLRAVGFSPLYSREFLYLVAQLQGADLAADGRGFPAWNQDGLKKSIDYINDWSKRYNGGPDKEQAFLDKFTYNPVYQLLHQGQFSFAFSRASDFLRQPESVTQGLNLHWPTWQDRTRLLDNFVAAGVPRRSAHKAEAMAFIEWLLQESVQNSAIKNNLDNNFYSFGFLQGFSSRRLVTEKSIPYYFPLVRLRIPPDSMLIFPDIQSIQWETFKNQVFSPWLHQQILSGGREISGLKNDSKQWLLQMGLNP